MSQSAQVTLPSTVRARMREPAHRAVRLHHLSHADRRVPHAPLPWAVLFVILEWSVTLGLILLWPWATAE